MWMFYSELVIRVIRVNVVLIGVDFIVIILVSLIC